MIHVQREIAKGYRWRAIDEIINDVRAFVAARLRCFVVYR